MKKVITAALIAAALMSCGQHRDGTSVWAEGLWIIPAVLLSAATIFLIVAWRAYQSGDSQQIPGRGTIYSDKKVPVYKIWAFWFALALIVAAAAVIIAVNMEKG